MSLSNLLIVFGGNGVVNPASLLEMSSDDSDDLLLRRLLPVPVEQLPSIIMLRGGGWVKKYALETPNIGPYCCCMLLAISATLVEDNDIGVLGKIRFGGDFPLIELGDKIDDTGEEAEECDEDVEGDGEGSRGTLQFVEGSSLTFP